MVKCLLEYFIVFYDNTLNSELDVTTSIHSVRMGYNDIGVLYR